MTQLATNTCPLCLEQKTVPYYEDKRRPYIQCKTCSLVFVPPSYYLSAEQEKAEYDKHENSLEDEGYRRFLSRTAKPLLERLEQPSLGLDFGCSMAPVLAHMLQEQGHTVSLYDHFYYSDKHTLAQSYDFITATEVIEHLHQPLVVLEQLWGLLKPAGYLVLMTKRVRDQQAFTTWHYKNDPTHVCFFSEATFSWLAQRWQAQYEIVAADVVIFTKP